MGTVGVRSNFLSGALLSTIGIGVGNNFACSPRGTLTCPLEVKKEIELEIAHVLSSTRLVIPRVSVESRLGMGSTCRRAIQWTWVVGGGARPTKMMMPSPPGFPPTVSMSKSGFQLLMDQMLPA